MTESTVPAQRLMLLDSASLYFRAFFGLPETITAPDGTPVNAVRGLLDFIAKLVTDYQPTHLIACWDDDWRPQWRVDLIPTYKTHRVAEEVEVAPDVEVVPDPLSVQVPIILEVLAAFGIPVVGAARHEADDVIGTLATGAPMPVDVVTGDRDLFQLIDDDADVRVIYTGRGMSNLEVLTDDDRSRRSTPCRPRSTPTSPRCAVTRPTACRASPAWGRRPRPRCSRPTATSTGSSRRRRIRRAPSRRRLRAKLLAASDYLAVAPTVVEVVRKLELPRGRLAHRAAAGRSGEARANPSRRRGALGMRRSGRCARSATRWPEPRHPRCAFRACERPPVPH